MLQGSRPQAADKLGRQHADADAFDQAPDALARIAIGRRHGTPTVDDAGVFHAACTSIGERFRGVHTAASGEDAGAGSGTSMGPKYLSHSGSA